MFSGKPEGLIRRLKRAEFAKQRVQNLSNQRSIRVTQTRGLFRTIKTLLHQHLSSILQQFYYWLMIVMWVGIDRSTIS